MADRIVIQRAPDRIVTGANATRVVQAGATRIIVGARGLPGPVGPGGSPTVTATAARALSGHRALILTASGADYPDLATAGDGERIVGLSTGAAALGGTVTLQLGGEMVESSWSWTPGPVFAGDDGVLTQSPPSGAWLRQVAVAFAPTRMVIDLRPSILL